MKSIKTVIAMSAIAGAAWSGVSFAANDGDNAAHAVFVMTNNADSNQVVAFQRDRNGTLEDPHSYRTDGRGSGGTVDPLSSQGSLTLSTDDAWLFAANAGSGSVSVFRVNGARLELTDRIATEGSEPNSVAQFGSLVYVLNTAGSSSVVGFHFHNGKLERIPNSQRFLSAFRRVGAVAHEIRPITEKLSQCNFLLRADELTAGRRKSTVQSALPVVQTRDAL